MTCMWRSRYSSPCCTVRKSSSLRSNSTRLSMNCRPPSTSIFGLARHRSVNLCGCGEEGVCFSWCDIDIHDIEELAIVRISHASADEHIQFVNHLRLHLYHTRYTSCDGHVTSGTSHVTYIPGESCGDVCTPVPSCRRRWELWLF